jgi:hypothetical protein
MPITINGSGTVTGISAGGLPDSCITTDDIAANAVTAAKLGADQASGLAKAWVNFNGTGTVAIRASFNVSSITDNGTGDYTVNFTTAMVDANYSVASHFQFDAANVTIPGNSFCQTFRGNGVQGQTASGVQLICSTGAGAATDYFAISASIFR